MNATREGRLAVASTIGVLGIAAAFALASYRVPAWGLVVLGVGAIDVYLVWMAYRSDLQRRNRHSADGFSDGDWVEVDCRGCGKFNRVPARRLRDRPICGRCKTRLMPGRRIVLCRSKQVEGRLNKELDALWSDEDLLWRHLADHFKKDDRAGGGDRRRMVN